MIKVRQVQKIKEKVVMISLLIISFLFGFHSVFAACSGSEANQLSKEAASVKASYEIASELMSTDDYDLPDGTDASDVGELHKLYFLISIDNLTENLYVKITNNTTKETKTYQYSDSVNGTIQFFWEDIYTLVNYTINVYSSNKTNCGNTKLATTYLTTPRYNDYSNLAVCNGAEKFYLCYQYVTTDEVDFNTFVTRVEEYKKGHLNEQGEATPEEEKGKFEKYKPLIVFGFGIIISAGVIGTVIIVIKKQGSRDL